MSDRAAIEKAMNNKQVFRFMVGRPPALKIRQRAIAKRLRGRRG